ncbi:MAG: dihydroneopterin aldolase [Pseudomonadota bacterium]
MYDKIFISNLQIHGFHGVYEAEKSLGQMFEFDIECGIRRESGAEDTLNNTVCYGAVCDLVYELSSSSSRFDLLETLAEHICAAIFETFDRVETVALNVRKPQAPIKYTLDHVGVRIERERPN